jgi:hypothetical protein
MNGGGDSTTTTSSSTDRLDQAEEDLQQDPQKDTKACGVKECPLNKQEEAKPRWHQVGLWTRVLQYRIQGRELTLQMPFRPNVGIAQADDLNDLGGSEFGGAVDYQGSFVPKKGLRMQQGDYPLFPLTAATRLRCEDGATGYQGDGADDVLNKLLGQAAAIHLRRTLTYSTVSTGNFKRTTLGARAQGLENTEKMGFKLCAYLKAEIDGKVGIYEIKDGRIGGEVSPQTYDQRKRLEDGIHYANGECVGIPVIPGVYQLHVLMEAGAEEGKFAIGEVYCDGDCIYPED